MMVDNLSLKEVLRRAQYLAYRFGADRCSEHAAALTYMSLFALVPMLTLLYAMASLLPVSEGLDQQIQDFLFTHLVPDSRRRISTRRRPSRLAANRQ